MGRSAFRRLSDVWRGAGWRGLAIRTWGRLWMTLAAIRVLRRPTTWLASLSAPPYYGQHALARLHPSGYTAVSARVHHGALARGDHTSLGDRVVVYRDREGGPIIIGSRSTINMDSCLQTGQGGRIEIGADTHIQPRCQFSAYVGEIRIGDRVSIAPNCYFYPYDHRTDAHDIIRKQGLKSSGDIVVDDDVWIGTGVIILQDVHIGRGAVLAAGAVITSDVPEMAIAAGVPAKVIGSRLDS